MRSQSGPRYYIKSCFERTVIIKTYKLESHLYKKEGQTLKLLFSAHEISFSKWFIRVTILILVLWGEKKVKRKNYKNLR